MKKTTDNQNPQEENPYGLLGKMYEGVKKDHQLKILSFYIGGALIMAFLFLASLAPQVGERLGQIAVKKQSQQSQAALDNPSSINDFYSNKTYISTITPLQSFTLTWKTTSVGFCNATGAWTGRKSANGSETLVMSLDQARKGSKYTLTCYGSNNQTVSKDIYVASPFTPKTGIAPGPCNPY